MAEIDVYTKDGTTTFGKKPADKEKTGTWKACPFILGNEFCERLAYYGMSTNLVNYLQLRFHMGNAEAAKQVSIWTGTCYLSPLLGAYLADTYLGRYWVILIFSIIYVCGMAGLTLTALIPWMKPSCDTSGVCHPQGYQRALLLIALYLIALGTGGIKPCVSSFGADQFDDTDETEKKKKGTYFNWFYFSINVGALIASSVLVYIQMNVGWGIGFGIPAIAMALAVVAFFSGTMLYRLQKPGGSPLTGFAQVIVASFRKCNVTVPADPDSLYETAEGEKTIEGSRKLKHTEGLSDQESSQPEGDINKQELLVKIAQLQAQKVRLTDYLDERSAYLTQFAEEANAEFDEIGESTLKGLDEAEARIMEKLGIQMQDFEESAESNRQEIEEEEKKLWDFEDQMDKDRNEGMFFKNLTTKAPEVRLKAKEEAEKLKEVNKEVAGSKIRKNIYLALMVLMGVGIADALITSSDWRKVAALGVILVGLLSQFIYEQGISAKRDQMEDKE
ncbi:NRT1/ PTR FAMILY 8.1 [Thalictrum thalictroides]|uniref:NRT1/ PTR FAMILY 8.1 n=1 Tax=Thalictrum thalictroides TaxID=46969 RepID=A0A7J6W396_THATH|nr:NRT1/ PTR FAMILY 8.1 [Thalictrum thalictroides]